MITLVFGLIIGLALGLTGGGGSIFAIPLLIFGLGLSPQEAITISLVTVTLVAVLGSVSAARNQLLEYRAGTIFAAAGITTAPVGVLIASHINDHVLLVTFALLMLAVAISMWIKASRTPGDSIVVRAKLGIDNTGYTPPPCQFNPEKQVLTLTAPCSAILVLTGIITGILAGMFGVGGGFIIVPALTAVTQLSIKRAVATSLYVITLVGSSALVSSLAGGRNIDWQIASIFLLGGLLGMFFGRLIAGKVSGPGLQKFFSIMMVVVAVITLVFRSHALA